MGRPIRDGLLYFPFDTDFFFADKRIKRIRSRMGNNGLLFYIYLLTEIYRNGYYIRWDEESVDNAIDDLGLTEGFIEQAMICLTARELITKIELTDSRQIKTAIITSPGIQKRYQEAVKNRKRQFFVDERIWLLSEEETATHIKVTNYESNSEKNESNSEKNESNSEKNDVNKNKRNEMKVNKNNMCKADAFALFERLWEMYPVKRGKGSVSDTQKMKLLKIGYEEMARAIERYKEYVESIDYLQYKNGSTFFNSGYIDYLDANYTEPERKKQKNSFNNFEQREYSFDELERHLLGGNYGNSE